MAVVGLRRVAGLLADVGDVLPLADGVNVGIRSDMGTSSHTGVLAPVVLLTPRLPKIGERNCPPGSISLFRRKAGQNFLEKYSTSVITRNAQLTCGAKKFFRAI